MTTSERHQHYTEIINPEISRLAGLICEATKIEDPVLEQSHYQELLAYYHQETKLGYWHPDLTEAVADFTAVRDPLCALPYYRLALEQARELECETHTILIAMAETFFELGQNEQAEACLCDGRAEALRRGDHETVREADRILQEASA